MYKDKDLSINIVWMVMKLKISFMNPMRPSDNPMILSVSQETGKAECGLELLMELHFSIPLRRNI